MKLEERIQSSTIEKINLLVNSITKLINTKN